MCGLYVIMMRKFLRREIKVLNDFVDFRGAGADF